jgi:hypothetical protein
MAIAAMQGSPDAGYTCYFINCISVMSQFDLMEIGRKAIVYAFYFTVFPTETVPVFPSWRF